MPYKDPEKKRASAREYARRRYAADPVGRAAYMRDWRRTDPTGRNHSWYVLKDLPGPEERFWAKVDQSSDPNGCWLWTGKRDANGYGRVRRDGRDTGAHRYSWALVNGPIPEGLKVRHFVCDNPPCVNPDHLRLGTQTDNLQDMTDHGRRRGPSTPDALAAAGMRLVEWRATDAGKAVTRVGQGIGRCSRWNLSRGKPCVCGHHATA